LPANFDGACVEVDVLPAQADRLGLANAEGERDRPAGAIATGGGNCQDAAGFFAG
jgi:hypothetical protein